MRGSQTLWFPDIPQQHRDTAERWSAGDDPIFAAIAAGSGPGADIPTSEIRANYELPFDCSPLTPRECHYALWRHAANAVALEALQAQGSANRRMREEADPLRDLGLWIGHVLEVMWTEYRIGLPDDEATAAWLKRHRMLASRGGDISWKIAWEESESLQSTMHIADFEAVLLRAACLAAFPVIFDEGALLSLVDSRMILPGPGLSFRTTAFARTACLCIDAAKKAERGGGG